MVSRDRDQLGDIVSKARIVGEHLSQLGGHKLGDQLMRAATKEGAQRAELVNVVDALNPVGGPQLLACAMTVNWSFL